VARKKDDSDRMLDAALALAAREGWRGLSLAAIANEAGIGLAEARAAFPSRSCMLAALLARTDREVLAGGRGRDRPRPVVRRADAAVRRARPEQRRHRRDPSRPARGSCRRAGRRAPVAELDGVDAGGGGGRDFRTIRAGAGEGLGGGLSGNHAGLARRRHRGHGADDGGPRPRIAPCRAGGAHVPADTMAPPPTVAGRRVRRRPRRNGVSLNGVDRFPRWLRNGPRTPISPSGSRNSEQAVVIWGRIARKVFLQGVILSI